MVYEKLEKHHNIQNVNNLEKHSARQAKRRAQKQNAHPSWADKKLIQNYIGINKYDCIVPFSGGKDSVYALWFLVTQIKMNPLVVRFDHNFLREKVKKGSYR